MEVALTWNLVLVAIFVILFAYNFLLGHSAAIKLIISIYIAVLTADGISRILQQYVFGASFTLQSLLGENIITFFIVVRIILFLLTIIFLVIKGNFHIQEQKHDHWAIKMGVHMGFCFLSSLLFLSTVLIYLSGSSFVEGILRASQISIYEQSLLARIMIDYYHLWVFLPAIAFLISSITFENEES